MVDHSAVSDTSWSAGRRDNIRIDTETVEILKKTAEDFDDRDETL